MIKLHWELESNRTRHFCFLLWLSFTKTIAVDNSIFLGWGIDPNICDAGWSQWSILCWTISSWLKILEEKRLWVFYFNIVSIVITCDACARKLVLQTRRVHTFMRCPDYKQLKKNLACCTIFVFSCIFNSLKLLHCDKEWLPGQSEHVEKPLTTYSVDRFG